MSDRQRHGFVLLLVAGLIAASVFVIATQKTGSGARSQGRRPARLPGRADPADPGGHPGRAEPRGRHHALARRPARRLRARDPDLGRQPDLGRPARRQQLGARRAARWAQTARLYFYDWEANVLTPERQAGAPASCWPRIPTAMTISQGGTAGQPGRPGRRKHAALPGGHARLQAAGGAARRRNAVAQGPEYYLFGAPGQRRLRRPRPRPTGRRRSRASTACSPARTTIRRARRVQAACPPGVTHGRGPAAGRPAGHGRAPGGQPTSADQPAQASTARTRSSTSSRTTSRYSATTSPTRSRAPTRPGSPDVTFGFNSNGPERVPERHRGRSPTAAQVVSLGGTSAQPALRGRARQPAGHGPADRLQAPTPTGSPAAAAPTSPAASPASRRRTWPPSCASARCRSSSSGSPSRRCRRRSASRRCTRA